MGKLLKCNLKGKTCRKLANGQDIDYSEKKKEEMAPGLHLPLHWDYFLYYNNIQICLLVYWYIQQISGERLQDHWSSGFYLVYFLLKTLIVGTCQNCLGKVVLTRTHNLNKKKMYTPIYPSFTI